MDLKDCTKRMRPTAPPRVCRARPIGCGNSIRRVGRGNSRNETKGDATARRMFSSSLLCFLAVMATVLGRQGQRRAPRTPCRACKTILQPLLQTAVSARQPLEKTTHLATCPLTVKDAANIPHDAVSRCVRAFTTGNLAPAIHYRPALAAIVNSGGI